MYATEYFMLFSYLKTNKRRILLVLFAVIGMGFSLSFLIRTNLGGDPYTCMNLAISDCLGISFGHWQALLNVVLLIIVVLCDRKLFGIGTLANMFLVGYCMDFFTWVEDFFLPESFSSALVRGLIAVPALVVFVISAALYMSCELGTAPYDAASFLLHKGITKARVFAKLPFRAVRIPYDLIACGICLLFGGSIGLVTLFISLFLGPVVDKTGEFLKRKGILD